MSSNLPQGSRVAVIGAGVSGLVAAKRLLEKGFLVTLYEGRRQIGGLWNFDEHPETAVDWNGRAASAVYGGLDTNFPRQLMELQDYPYKKQPLFMPHDRVLKYLRDYSKTLFGDRFRLRSDQEVIDMYYEKSDPKEAGVWHLTSRDVSTRSKLLKDFEGVVVAVGMFDKPYFPGYEGLEQWKELWPQAWSHAKSYRGPKPFRNKKVLIIGYGASGFDIASRIEEVAAKVWVSSGRDISGQLPKCITVMPEISHLDPKNRQVFFKDGRKLWRVDHILFCTGYQFSQPFIKAGYRAREPMFPDGPTIENLHEHMIYKENPTLAFMGIVQGGAPTFLIVQAQAAYLSRLWAGQLSLQQPSKEPNSAESTKEDNARHSLLYPEFMDYLLRLEKMCETADEALATKEDEDSEDEAENLPFSWTLELDWIRQNRREIREAFMDIQKPGRKSVNTLDQLGFSVKSLTPASQNITQVIPFLILHTAYFPDRRQPELLHAFFPPRSQDTDYPGAVFFENVKKIFHTTEGQLPPESKQLFRQGAKKLLEFGLARVEEAVSRVGDQEGETSDVPGTATKSKGKEDAAKPAPSPVSLSLERHQRQMKAVFAELFPVT